MSPRETSPSRISAIPSPSREPRETSPSREMRSPGETQGDLDQSYRSPTLSSRGVLEAFSQTRHGPLVPALQRSGLPGGSRRSDTDRGPRSGRSVSPPRSPREEIFGFGSPRSTATEVIYGSDRSTAREVIYGYDPLRSPHGVDRATLPPNLAARYRREPASTDEAGQNASVPSTKTPADRVGPPEISARSLLNDTDMGDGRVTRSKSAAGGIWSQRSETLGESSLTGVDAGLCREEADAFFKKAWGRKQHVPDARCTDSVAGLISPPRERPAAATLTWQARGAPSPLSPRGRDLSPRDQELSPRSSRGRAGDQSARDRSEEIPILGLPRRGHHQDAIDHVQLAPAFEEANKVFSPREEVENDCSVEGFRGYRTFGNNQNLRSGGTLFDGLTKTPPEHLTSKEWGISLGRKASPPRESPRSPEPNYVDQVGGIVFPESAPPAPAAPDHGQGFSWSSLHASEAFVVFPPSDAKGFCHKGFSWPNRVQRRRALDPESPSPRSTNEEPPAGLPSPRPASPSPGLEFAQPRGENDFHPVKIGQTRKKHFDHITWRSTNHRLDKGLCEEPDVVVDCFFGDRRRKNFDHSAESRTTPWPGPSPSPNSPRYTLSPRKEIQGILKTREREVANRRDFAVGKGKDWLIGIERASNSETAMRKRERAFQGQQKGYQRRWLS